jgi:Holliday junction DNA helicase RuvA
MIRQVRGEVVDSSPGVVTVLVGGVGYQVAVATAPADLREGTTVTLYTHLAVRENALDLYGFIDPADLTLFEHLLTLPKIGPKTALQFMGQADRNLIEQAVAMEDPEHLTKLSGITKKSAEKIVMGLKDKLDIAPEVADTDAPVTANHTDAIEALMTLGYPQRAAREAIQAVQNDGETTDDTPALVNRALRHLSRG